MQESLACEKVEHGLQTPSESGVGEPGQLFQKPSVVEKVYKVLVGIPLFGGTPSRAYHDRMLMFDYMGGKQVRDFYEKTNPRYVFSHAATEEMLVPFARERMAESALNIGADYLFMIDDDMLAPMDVFYKLVENDKDICAALAFTRNPDHQPVIYQEISGRDPTTNTHYGFLKFAKTYPRDTLVQCDAVGFGAILIKTEVLKKVPQPWFFGMERTGEDIQFCVKSRQHGFEVWMDTRIKLGHLGAPVVIDEAYADQWHKLTVDQKERLHGKYKRYATR